MKLSPAFPSSVASAAIAAAVEEEVPGFAIGVLHAGEAFVFTHGVTSVANPLPVTPETLFLIGSTSKTFTATALMQLVEEGRVDLEATVRTYLPDFRLQSDEDAARLTVRHLVTHHGGWVGDYFRDCGRGDDALAKIVSKMANSPQLTPAGYTYCYSNAGLYVVGRIIEVVTGQVFEQVIRERVIDPLGMDHTFYFPEEAMLHRYAMGHTRTTDGPVQSATWTGTRAIAPASDVIASVVDQLRYAEFHLGDGTSAANGQRLMRGETLRYMQAAQAEGGSMCEEIGVAWFLTHAGGEQVVMHGGSIMGQLSSFEMIPSRQFAVVVLTNSDSGRGVRQSVVEACRQHFLGIGIDPEPAPIEVPGGLKQYAGRYLARLFEAEVVVADGRLVISERSPFPVQPGRAAAIPTPSMRAAFFATDRAAILDLPRRGETCEFLRDADGNIEWMRWDGRIARRQN